MASFSPLLNIDPSGVGGTSVVILSTVQYVNTAQCQAGGYTSTCPNNGLLVFTNQQVIGKAALHTSTFGSPTTDAYGNVPAGSPTSNGYLNLSSALVQNFPSITLTSSGSGQQYGYIAEIYSQNVGPVWFTKGITWINSTCYF
jgi:hypothetical protein